MRTWLDKLRRFMFLGRLVAVARADREPAAHLDQLLLQERDLRAPRRAAEHQHEEECQDQRHEDQDRRRHRIPPWDCELWRERQRRRA